jgi:hypothetical protein
VRSHFHPPVYNYFICAFSMQKTNGLGNDFSVGGYVPGASSVSASLGSLSAISEATSTSLADT